MLGGTTAAGAAAGRARGGVDTAADCGAARAVGGAAFGGAAGALRPSADATAARNCFRSTGFVRALLVDADMRTPRQQAVFDIGHPMAGLSGILSGRAEQNVIVQIPDLPSLYLLPAGAVPPNPLELVQRPAFGLLMQELLNKFDYVVVDTPAATHGADARVIAAKCGAALVMARKGTSRIKPLNALLKALSKGPTKLAGVVMNEF